MQKYESRWLACVVCGDDSEFEAIDAHGDADELMCARCGQARLVLRLGAVGRVVGSGPPSRRRSA